MTANPSPLGFDPAMFRRVLGRFPTGVVVVTAIDADGRQAGMAVGSFTSVSLDRPLLGLLPVQELHELPPDPVLGLLLRERALRPAGAGVSRLRHERGGQVRRPDPAARRRRFTDPRRCGGLDGLRHRERPTAGDHSSCRAGCGTSTRGPRTSPSSSTREGTGTSPPCRCPRPPDPTFSTGARSRRLLCRRRWCRLGHRRRAARWSNRTGAPPSDQQPAPEGGRRGREPDRRGAGHGGARRAPGLRNRS